MTGWPFGDLLPFSFDVILADPPWLFELRSEAGEAKSAQAQYDCIPTEEIMALPVGHLAAGDSAGCGCGRPSPCFGTRIA